MFDEITFGLRYGPVVRIVLFLVQCDILVPLTQDTIDTLKRDGWWLYLEDRFAPYLVTEENIPRSPHSS
jgi:hypothetical protein